MKHLSLLLLTLSLLISFPTHAQGPDETVSISWPPPITALTGTITITGTANHPQMTGYFLEYRPLPQDPTTDPEAGWFPATLPQPTSVTDGDLGTWDTTTVPDGAYELRLVVNLADGSSVTHVVTPLRVENGNSSTSETSENRGDFFGDWSAGYIYLLNTGTGETSHVEFTLPGGTSRTRGHDWLPDGSQITFVLAEGGQWDFNLYVMNADGHKIRNITNTQGIAYSEPAWSPDGTQIAFLRMAEGSQTWELYAVHIDGSNIRRLGSWSQDHGWANQIAWLPNNNQFLVEVYFTLYTFDLETGAMTALTDHLGCSDPRHFDVSPDGSQVAFPKCEYTDGELISEDIYITSLDGGPPRQLTDDGMFYVDPTWSPDGAHIAFCRSDPDTNSFSAGQLSVIDVDGTNLRVFDDINCYRSYGTRIEWLSQP